MTLPETNSKFDPANGWLEDNPFLLGCFGLVAQDVSFRGTTVKHDQIIIWVFPKIVVPPNYPF